MTKTQLDAQQIRDLFLCGETFKSIGAMAGVSGERVRQIALIGGHTKSSLREEYDKQQADKVIVLAVQGMTRSQIAKELDWSIFVVDKLCRKFKIETVVKWS